MVQPLLLTFGRLCEILETRLACTKIRLMPAGEMTDTDGTPTPAVYAFTRVVDDVQYEVIVHVYEEFLPVMDDMLRYIADRLHIADRSDLGEPN